MATWVPAGRPLCPWRREAARQTDPQPFRLPRQHRAVREPGGRVKGARRRAAVLLASLALAGASALLWGAGAEESVQLKDAPGRDLTTGRCIICHSLEYIPSNAPAMNRAAWQKTIQKMKDRFGA